MWKLCVTSDLLVESLSQGEKSLFFETQLDVFSLATIQKRVKIKKGFYGSLDVPLTTFRAFSDIQNTTLLQSLQANYEPKFSFEKFI